MTPSSLLDDSEENSTLQHRQLLSTEETNTCPSESSMKAHKNGVLCPPDTSNVALKERPSCAKEKTTVSQKKYFSRPEYTRLALMVRLSALLIRRMWYSTYVFRSSICVAVCTQEIYFSSSRSVGVGTEETAIQPYIRDVVGTQKRPSCPPE
jgi:hypothetical protein